MKKHIFNNTKRILVVGLIAVMTISSTLAGCGKKNVDETEDDSVLAKIPELSKFDDGMKLAHFISAPVDIYTVEDAIESGDIQSKKLCELTDNYSASYVMTMTDASSSFLLSDGMGEYGQMIAVELSEHDDENAEDNYRQIEITVREILGGGLGSPLASEVFSYEPTGTEMFDVHLVVEKDILSVEVEPVEDENVAEAGGVDNNANNVTVDETAGTVDSVKADVTVKNTDVVQTDAVVESVDYAQAEGVNSTDTKANEDVSESTDDTEKSDAQTNTASGNNQTTSFKIESVNVPDIKIGAIGLYRYRGAALSYIDDILVKSKSGSVLFKEDFEDRSNNIFSPYYTDTRLAKMAVDYGLLLTQASGTPAPVFRKDFTLDNTAEIYRAYLYMTALGSFEASINGQAVSNNYFDPGRLNYNDKLNYASFDITNLLSEENTIDITLYHGFYDRGVGYYEAYAPFGGTNAIKGELVIEYNDGTFKIIPTDESFGVSNDGPVRFDDIYQGEIIDTNHDLSEYSFEPVDVDDVESKYLSMDVLPKETDNIKSVLDLNPVTVTEPVAGVYVYDFGQNFAGNITVNLPSGLMAKASDDNQYVDGAISFRYGETLNTELLLNADGPVGTVFTDNLLSAKATDYFLYTSVNESLPKGVKLEPGTPVNSRENPALYTVDFSATYHGFRYLEITGVTEQIPVDCITAHVLSTAMEQTGYFSSSNAALNRYYENSRFSILSNFLDTPTDCAQRDERLGWSGDAFDSSGFASFILNTDDFYSKYIRDLCARQLSDGSMMDIAPQRIGGDGNNCWGDAAINIAYELYVQYGDKDILIENYDSFKKWVDYLISTSDDYIRYHSTYGDHLSIQSTVPELSDTSWCAHSADLMSRIARVAGNTEDEEYYRSEFEKYKQAWQNKFVREDGSVEAGILYDESETAYALGICFKLFEDDMLQNAADRLKILAEYSNYQFGPGYSGLTFVLPALARYGHADTAMNILTNTDKGSPLYTVGIGMTTTPELLNGINYNDNGTYIVNGSLNHHAYAGICAYLYTDILGIRPDEEHPGYRHFYLSPKVSGSLTSAEGTYTTAHGDIGVSVKTNSLDVVIPEGTTCTLTLPDGTVKELTAGGYSYTW